MTSSNFKRLPKNTLEIILKIPWEEVNKDYQNAFTTLQQELSIEGFRKGKVPKSLAEKHLKKEAILNQALKTLLPKVYEEILKKENLKPIVSPKIELVSAKEKTDWEVKFTLAEKPEIVLGNYKEEIKKIKTDDKKSKIWTPGQPQKTETEDKEKNKQKILNEVLESLLKNVKCEISDLIIEDELNRRLSKFVDDLQKLGLTVESYLKSNNLTADQLRAKFSQEITDTYKLEFILAEVAEAEKISVDQSDLDKVFSNIKTEADKEEAKKNSYFYASLLRKQKTLDFLISL